MAKSMKEAAHEFQSGTVPEGKQRSSVPEGVFQTYVVLAALTSKRLRQENADVDAAFNYIYSPDRTLREFKDEGKKLLSLLCFSPDFLENGIDWKGLYQNRLLLFGLTQFVPDCDYPSGGCRPLLRALVQQCVESEGLKVKC
jgi:hypothetical protein